MRRFALIALAALLAAAPALAEVLVPVRMIRPGEILASSDMKSAVLTAPGALRPGERFAGLEARVTLFPGRPVATSDLVPPRLVRRNDLVTLVYLSGALSISAEGRALDDGAVGERVPVINIASRTRLSGRVTEDGRVLIQPMRN